MRSDTSIELVTSVHSKPCSSLLPRGICGYDDRTVLRAVTGRCPANSILIQPLYWSDEIGRRNLLAHR